MPRPNSYAVFCLKKKKAAILAGLVLGLGAAQLAKIFWHTIKRMKRAVITVSFMLALVYTTRYSGLDAVLGLAFTRSGWFYPFFFSYLDCHRLDLPSFPTRRSSDLPSKG